MIDKINKIFKVSEIYKANMFIFIVTLEQF